MNRGMKPVAGLDEDGKPALYVTPFVISKLSVMHLRGRPLPAAAVKFIETGEDPLAAVAAMQKYYDEYEKNKKKTKK